MQFAVLGAFKNITQIIEADSLELAIAGSGSECVPYKSGQIGWIWHEELNHLAPPSPHDSWTWNAETNAWIAPEPRPETGEHYWDEESLSWIALEPIEDTPAENSEIES